MCGAPFINDQDHIDLIGRYRSAWQRCMNYYIPAATGLQMTCYRDNKGLRARHCHIMTVRSDESPMVELR